MIIKRNSCNFVLLVLGISILGVVNSQQSCEVSINKREYRPDKILFTHKQYEVTFGVPWEPFNPPIGYSIDADCKNLSKLRVAYSFDIKDMPIEINSINCSKTINFINVLEPSTTFSSKKSSNNSYLTFLIDFRFVY